MVPELRKFINRLQAYIHSLIINYITYYRYIACSIC